MAPLVRERTRLEAEAKRSAQPVVAVQGPLSPMARETIQFWFLTFSAWSRRTRLVGAFSPTASWQTRGQIFPCEHGVTVWSYPSRVSGAFHWPPELRRPRWPPFWCNTVLQHLYAIGLWLCYFHASIRYQRVLVECSCRHSVTIVRAFYSRQAYLWPALQFIRATCVRFCVVLRVAFVPRSLNNSCVVHRRPQTSPSASRGVPFDGLGPLFPTL